MKSLVEITQEDVISMSYTEIQEIIKEISKVSLNQQGLVQGTEVYANCFMCIGTIRKRVENNDFTELNSTDKKQKLLNTLTSLKNRISYFSDINTFMRSNQETFQRHMLKTQAEITQQLNKTVSDVNNEFEKTKKQLDDSEHNILTHVLTLLGVFSAIIITIMSVVITTNSWLNNAGTEGFMMALLVPGLIVIFSVIVLVSLVYAYHNIYSSDDKKKYIPFVIFLSVVTVLTIVLGCMLGSVIKTQRKSCTATHIRYVIPESEYRLITEPVPGTEDVNQYYNFTVDGENVVVPYNKNLVHDGDLYYCTECRVLE